MTQTHLAPKRRPRLLIIGFSVVGLCMCLSCAVLAIASRSSNPASPIESSGPPAETTVAAVTSATSTARPSATRQAEVLVSTSTPFPPKTPSDTLPAKEPETRAPSPSPSPQYVALLGRIWTGVKVYYGIGPAKEYGFEILGGSEDCPTIPSGRGVFVRYPDGSEEWKDRDYLISSDLFYVLKNDPASTSLEWYEYFNCP